MIVVFDDPKTGEDREFNFDLDDIDVVQSRYIKRHVGLTPKALMAGLNEGDPDALVALYWLMLNQNGIGADLSKVNFKLAKFGDALNTAAVNERAGQLGITADELRDVMDEAEKRDVELDDILAERGIDTNPTKADATTASN